MSLSANISTRLVKGRFGSGVVAGPDGETLLVPARGRIDFEGRAPWIPYPTGSPEPFTMLRPRATGVIDSEGYLCTPDPVDKEKAGARMLLLQAPNDPESSVQGWTWVGTPRFVDADGSRVQGSMDPFKFDLPFGDEPFDLALVVDVPSSVGVGKEQAVILAAKAQAYAASAADDAEAARADADVSAAAAVDAAAGVKGARVDAESARLDADRAVGLIGAAEGSAGAAASSAAGAEREATAAKVAAGTASAAAGRSADESAGARSAAGTAVTASAEAVSTANSAKTIATSVETRANAGEFKGTKGDTGPVNKLTIGTVAKADTASATITGTAPNQTLNLQLPKGETGPAVALSIGTVTSGATAAATVTGTGASQTLNLTLPKGDAGGLGNLPILDDGLNLNTLNVTGIYTNRTVGGTIANNYPVGGMAGITHVYPVAQNSGIVVQEWRPSAHAKGISEWSRGYYTRLGNSGTWSPWRFVASQRVDNTVGRTIYIWDDTANREQLIYGDTGNVNIAPLLHPSFQAPDSVDRVNIRRVGNSVTLTLRVKPAESTVGLSRNENRVILTQIPAGFRENPTSYGNSYVGTASPAFAALGFGATNTNADFRVRGPGSETWRSGEIISLVANWFTNDPWPTTLTFTP